MAESPPSRCEPHDAREVGHLAALASGPAVTVARLRLVLAHHDPCEAYAVVAGRARAHPAVGPLLASGPGAAWRASVLANDPDAWARRCSQLGIGAVTARSAGGPTLLWCDPQPPAVVFFRGSWAALDQRRVGVVGTRNATGAGLAVARGLGRDLARAGVAVVSGLARGIDGAAHRGLLRTRADAVSRDDGVDRDGIDGDGVGGAGIDEGGHGVDAVGNEGDSVDGHGARDRRRPIGLPIGVVANGLDQPYPPEHGLLWSAVADEGVLLSEWPPGTAPERFRFPLRNRLIAALSEVLVVVESRERGGSLTTAREALERDVQVMAVPGSVRNRAASGTNQLLRDGAAPVMSADDVLDVLGLDHRRAPGRSFDPRPRPRGRDADVLAWCRGDPATLDAVAAGLGLSVVDAAMALARLERSGWLREAAGWFEAVEAADLERAP